MPKITLKKGINTKKMSLYSIAHLLPPPQLSISTTSTTSPNLITTTSTTITTKPSSLLTNLLSLSLSLTFTLSSPLPSLALPSLNSSQSQPPTFSSPTTPFSQSKNLAIGLENGKIRGCPSVNPACISTNPKSANFEFPWEIPSDSVQNALQKLKDAILSTQKNAEIQAVEDTPNGQYLRAMVDGGIGGFGRDVMEFLVKGDVVTYRCMASKVNYIYPFTTAFGDSKGQVERMNKIVEYLGWYVPNLDMMD